MEWNRRIAHVPAEGKSKIEFYFNDRSMIALEGEPIAVALLANGIQAIRTCEITGERRGIYCGIGHCFECRAVVDGIPNVRTCLTVVKQGMRVQSAVEVQTEDGETK